jgi:hypothetical protein
MFGAERQAPVRIVVVAVVPAKAVVFRAKRMKALRIVIVEHDTAMRDGPLSVERPR